MVLLAAQSPSLCQDVPLPPGNPNTSATLVLNHWITHRIAASIAIWRQETLKRTAGWPLPWPPLHTKFPHGVGRPGALDHLVIQGGFRQFHVMAVGAIDFNGQWDAACLGQQAALDAAFAAIRRIGAGFSPKGALVIARSSGSQLQLMPLNWWYSSNPSHQKRLNTPASCHSEKRR